MQIPINKRFRFRFHDWLYYSRLPREVSGLLHFLRGAIRRDTTTKLERAIDAYRFRSIRYFKRSALRKIRNQIPSSLWREQKIGWSRYADQLEDPILTRTVVLKAPGENGETDRNSLIQGFFTGASVRPGLRGSSH